MRKSLLPLIAFLAFIPYNNYAQANRLDNGFAFGLMAGGTMSKTKALETTILSEPFFLNYTLKPYAKYGGTAAFFASYRPGSNRNETFGGQVEVSYSQQGSKLKFNNSEKDFHYDMQFRYQYINVAALAKIYPFNDTGEDWRSGFNIEAGFQFGFNVAHENITYVSGGPGYLQSFGTDLEQQQQLRNVLKGNNATAAVGGLCYEFPRVVISARYLFGLNDVTETLPNSYNFIENKNKNYTAQLTIAFIL